MEINARIEIKDDKEFKEEIRNVVRKEVSLILDNELNDIAKELLERKMKDGKIDTMLERQAREILLKTDKPSLYNLGKELLNKEIIGNIETIVFEKVREMFSNYDKSFNERISKGIKDFFAKMRA